VSTEAAIRARACFSALDPSKLRFLARRNPRSRPRRVPDRRPSLEWPPLVIPSEGSTACQRSVPRSAYPPVV